MSAPLRIAYFSPLPPARSGIADYSAELLPHLAQHADLTLFVDDPTVATDLGLPVRVIADYPQRRWDYDVTLYQMGNSSHHEQIYAMLLRYPGVVVLHDLFLHHFVVDRTAGQHNTADYARELSYALGSEGRQVFEDIRHGRRPSPLAEVPLNNRLLDTSLATIVHSEFARSRITEQHPQARTAVIPQLIAHRQGQTRRAELGLAEGVVIFGSVGQITAARQMPQVLQALRTLLNQGIDAHFLAVGEVLAEVDLEHVITELNLEAYVTRIGFVPSMEDFADWIATMDVVLNLRVPTMGETSASVLRAMDLERPVIVNDHGWYSELPDEAALKLPADSDETVLLAAMTALAQDSALRHSLGQAAATYVARLSRPEEVARAYIDFLESLRQEWRDG